MPGIDTNQSDISPFSEKTHADCCFGMKTSRLIAFDKNFISKNSKPGPAVYNAINILILDFNRINIIYDFGETKKPNVQHQKASQRVAKFF